MRGAPPLGPGAEPMERLLAFGRSRLDLVLKHADLIRNAGFGGANRSFAAYSFAATHVRYLLGELGVRGDIALLAVALLAPLELPILDQQLRIEQIDVERIYAGWADLARRITRPEPYGSVIAPEHQVPALVVALHARPDDAGLAPSRRATSRTLSIRARWERRSPRTRVAADGSCARVPGVRRPDLRRPVGQRPPDGLLAAGTGLDDPAADSGSTR